MEVNILNPLIDPKARKTVLRFGIEGNTLGFWFSPTTNGISMGPIIPGEEHIHLTFFINGEVVNAHIKIVENGKPKYKNLTVMSPHQFRQEAETFAENMVNSFQPISPNEDAILVTNQACRLFQKITSGSFTVTYKGRTRYLDFDFGIIANKIQNLVENPIEYFTLGKAQNLINSDSFKLGMTEEGIPIFPVNNKIYSWDFLGQTSYGIPFNELTNIIGIPQLFSEIEQRKLFEKWSRKNLYREKSEGK